MMSKIDFVIIDLKGKMSIDWSGIDPILQKAVNAHFEFKNIFRPFKKAIKANDEDLIIYLIQNNPSKYILERCIDETLLLNNVNMFHSISMWMEDNKKEYLDRDSMNDLLIKSVKLDFKDGIIFSLRNGADYREGLNLAETEDMRNFIQRHKLI